MEENISYQALLIVMVLAATMPLVLNRFKQMNIPIVVGEIIAGLIIGNSGFHWVDGNDLLINFLSEFGLVFLMFLAGMEIDLSVLSVSPSSRNKISYFKNPINLAIWHFVITLVLSFGISFLLYTNGLIMNYWMMSLILSTTSLGIVVPVLKEKNIIQSKFGQTILFAALFADFATMLLITALVAILSRGLSVDLLLIGLLFVAFFFLYKGGILFFNRIKPIRRAIEELSYTTTQIKVRFAISIMLILVVLSELIGSEIILGAFLAGIIIRLISTPADAHVANQLETIGYGFLIPIFFIKVGVEINIPAILSSSNIGIIVPILLLSTILVKVVPSLLYKFAYTWKETLAAGLLLSSRLSLIIAAAAIGVNLQIISVEIQSIIILIAVFSVMVFPPLFNMFVPTSTALVQKKYLIIGAGTLGQDIAKQLISHKEAVAVLADSKDNVTYLQNQNIPVFRILNDFYTSEEIKNLISSSSSVISTLSNIDNSLALTRHIKSINQDIDILVLVDNPNDVYQFNLLGIKTFSWIVDTPALIAAMVRNPITYELFTDSNSEKDISEVILQNQALFGKKLRTIHLPGDVLIYSIRRDGELILPHGGTQIMHGDSITIAGTKDCLEEAISMFL